MAGGEATFEDNLAYSRYDPGPIGPSDPAQVVAAFHGASNVQVTNANINVVGGDSHTHMHYHVTTKFKDLKAFLDVIFNVRKIQQDTLAKATPGTVKWLFVSKYFGVWWNRSGTMKILWGSGIPGAGKTILASLVIDEVEHRAADPADQICVGYFYMRYSEHGEVTVRGVLEVLVKQTLERHEDLLQFAEKVYAHHIREGTRPTEGQLLALLQEFTAHMKTTFYILDALDEAPVDIQHDLVEKLASLNARIFITSRPMQNVQAYFPEAHRFVIAAQDRDLDLHIAKKLQGSPTLRALLDRGEASVKQRLISTVKSKCGGMFLHAQLDALQGCPSVHSVIQTLDRFPAKIEDAYRQTWQRILDQDLEHHLSKACPSLGAELLCVIAICPETHNFEEERLVLESTIIDLCYGLLTVDKESQLVRLVHYTAKQPIEDLLRIPFPHPHSLLAAVCIARLTDCGFQNTSITSAWELDTTLRADPLLHYAHIFWIFHAQESLDLDLTDNRMSAFVAGCHAFPVTDYSRDLYFGTFDILNSFHMVAFYNLPIAFAGPGNAHAINAQTVKHKFLPLHLAIIRGNTVAIQGLLCSPSICLNTRADDGETGLILACRRALKNIVELLLAPSDVDVNVADHSGRTPLIIASSYDSKGSVELLLVHPRINVNLVDHGGNTALISASHKGHDGIAALLLAHPNIQVNLTNNDGDTALLLAASREGSASVLKLLLAHPDIDVSCANKRGDTPLVEASHNGYGSIVRLLIAHPNIEINRVNTNGSTALLLAASRESNTSTVKLLLAHPDIDVNLADWDGDTPLTNACRNGYDSVVALLLSHPNTKVNLVNNDAKDTALLLAASSESNTSTVKLLLAHPDIDVNLLDEQGDTALINASRQGFASIVALLLAHPAIQVNVLNDGETALIAASSWRGNGRTVELLLAHPNIEVDLPGMHGNTAFMVASCKGHLPIVKRLVAASGVDVNRTNEDGETAIKMAAERGHESAVQTLLEVPGVDISVRRTRDRHTAMSAAFAKGYYAIVRLLQNFEST